MKGSHKEVSKESRAKKIESFLMGIGQSANSRHGKIGVFPNSQNAKTGGGRINFEANIKSKK
jgi:hypothetical protein